VFKKENKESHEKFSCFIALILGKLLSFAVKAQTKSKATDDNLAYNSSNSGW